MWQQDKTTAPPGSESDWKRLHLFQETASILTVKMIKFPKILHSSKKLSIIFREFKNHECSLLLLTKKRDLFWDQTHNWPSVHISDWLRFGRLTLISWPAWISSHARGRVILRRQPERSEPRGSHCFPVNSGHILITQCVHTANMMVPRCTRELSPLWQGRRHAAECGILLPLIWLYPSVSSLP